METRNGVTVIRFFPRNLYWNFARSGEPAWRRAIWHLRDAWNRDAARQLRTVLDAAPVDIAHTHLLDGFSASVWHRARRAGIPVIHTAHDYHLLCPRAFLLDRQWRICQRPSTGCRLYRAWHLRTAAKLDLFVITSKLLLEQHRLAGFSPSRYDDVRNGIPLPPDAARLRAQAARRREAALSADVPPDRGEGRVRVALQAAAGLAEAVGTSN